MEYLAAFLIIFFLLSVIASIVVAKFYGDELKEHATELIHENIDAKFSVEEIGISVLKNFPNISLYLSNVTIWSGTVFNSGDFGSLPHDTLLTAERIYIRFNLPDLLRKRFSITRLEARDGSVRILIDKSGKGNYTIAGNKSEKEKSRLVEMRGVHVKNFQFQYVNIAKEVVAGGKIHEMFFEGNFFDQNYTLKSGGTAFFDKITNHNVTYLYKQEIHSQIDIRVEQGHYSISKGELLLGELSAGIKGNFYIDKDKGVDLDLLLTGNKIDIEWLTSILAHSKKFPEGISSKGKFDLSVQVSGLLSTSVTPNINADFSSNKMSLELKKAGLRFNSVSLNGKYTNGDLKSAATSLVNIHAIRANTENSSISGSIKLQNFITPEYEATLLGDIKASELKPFISKWPIITGEGRIKPSLILNGSLNRKGGIIEKVSLNPVGKIEIEDLHLSIEQKRMEFRKLNGTFNIDPNRWATEIQGYLNDTDFSVSLAAKNPVNAITGKATTEIEGEIYSSNMNIDQLFAAQTFEEEGESGMIYPDNVSAIIKFEFDKITKGQIQSGKVSGNLNYKYPGLYIDPVYLETMNGVINSRIALFDLHKPVHQLSINSSYRSVEINQVFRSFNNFGQEFLTHQNIEGTISGNSDFFTTLNDNFSIHTADIVSENEFVIEHGELINFQPLIELSEFLKVDKMDHVHFSNLSNTILINNGTITIPQMEINSSALNLQASGTHGFDKKYKYHVSTKLSELLFNKARNNPEAEFNIALDKNDRRTIFLVLYDDGSGMTVEFDEAQAIKKIRQDLKNEKDELKRVLNKEFGMFDEDESGKQGTEPVEDPVLEFDFSPMDTVNSTEENKAEKPRWWKRKDSENKKPVFDFVIDDSDL